MTIKVITENAEREVAVFDSRDPQVDTIVPVDMGAVLLGQPTTAVESPTESRSAGILTGLERARARGVRLGRPRISVDIERVRAMRAEGRSHWAIGRALGISASTVSRTLAATAAALGAVKNIHAQTLEAAGRSLLAHTRTERTP